ncbi:MAG: hypothetical protein PHV02_21440 [Rhodocyclaceae bacterium]|nr:hypothetical protein [Rhodocyclaceae bacterium]
MSAEKSLPTAEVIGRAESSLGDICQYMLAIKHILDAAGADGTFGHFHTAIECLVNRAGALSDGILEEFGRTQAVGDNEAWFSSQA